MAAKTLNHPHSTINSRQSTLESDIRDTLAGDGEAYRRVIERHQQEIARRLRKFSRDPRVIEELVQETLRPMLKEWLDKNLPQVVERYVEREIVRLTRR